MSEFRIEQDSMGEVKVPAQAYYSAQTQRAVENFPVSGWRLPPALVRAMGLVKFACAIANRDLGKLTGERQASAHRRPGRRTARRCQRSRRRQTGGSVPDRRLSNRLWHFQQHERQRSHQQSRH